MKAFDVANLKRPEFIVEQGGVTAIIPREVFMATRGDTKPNRKRTENDTKPNRKRTENDTEPNRNRTETDTEPVKTEQKVEGFETRLLQILGQTSVKVQSSINDTVINDKDRLLQILEQLSVKVWAKAKKSIDKELHSLMVIYQRLI